MLLAIGMPILDVMPGEAFPHHVKTIVEAVRAWPNNEVVTIMPHSLAPHDFSRYAIVEEALKRGCDKLFMMDDDTITPSGGVVRLMDILKNPSNHSIKFLSEESAKKPVVVVSGHYLRRGYPYTSVWSVEDNKNWYCVDTNYGVHEIHVTGLGCAMIDLAWVEKNVPKPWFKMRQHEHYTAITDDTEFFRKIREAGGAIVGDTQTSCPHIGKREWIHPGTADELRLVDKAFRKQMEGQLWNVKMTPPEGVEDASTRNKS